MNFLTKSVIPLFLTSIIVGCSSGADKERQIEAIAQHRANTLSNNLPIEHGPLTIMKAKAKGNAIELMMLYNGEGTIPAQQLLAKSLSYYCANSEVKANLEHGIVYHIKLRSPRGQLLTEKVISESDCEKNIKPETAEK